MDQPHSTRQPKYLKFRTLYAKCFVLSLPVAAYGALIGSMLYLYANDTYKLFCLPLGLLVALFAYPLLFSNMRRRALVLVDVYFMALMMVALIVMQNQEFFYIAIGVGVGCGWAAVQGYVREVAGWEDRRASHINNLPNIMFVVGLCASFLIYDVVPSTVYVIVFGVALALSSIRWVLLLTLYNGETPVYHMKRFEELRGKLLLQQIYKQDEVDYIEHSHIANNEKLNDVNRSYGALFKRNYLGRFVCVALLNLTLWVIIPFPFFDGFKDTSDPELTNVLIIVTITGLALMMLSGFLFYYLNKRMSLLLTSVLHLLLNCILEVLIVMHYQNKIDDSTLFFYFNTIGLINIILFFLVLLPGIQMYTFQLVPDKGWAIATNLQWIGMAVMIYLGTMQKYDVAGKKFLSDEDERVFIQVYAGLPISCLIQVIALALLGKEVQGMTESQIMIQYFGKQLLN